MIAGKKGMPEPAPSAAEMPGSGRKIMRIFQSGESWFRQYRKTPKTGGMITGKREMPEGTVPETVMKNPGHPLILRIPVQTFTCGQRFALVNHNIFKC